MISLEEIDKRGYRFVLGERDFVASQPGQAIELDLLHGHTSLVDGLDSPEAVIDTALELGIDNITLSDHDTNEGNLTFGEMIRDRGGHSRQGVEYTAARFVSGDLASQVHILAHQVDVDSDNVLVVPRELMPPEEFNVYVHELGGVTTAAHPTFRDESLTRAEIERIQANSDPRRRFDHIEVANYGVDQADAGVRLAGPLGTLMRRMGRWPTPGANAEARAIYEDHRDDPGKNAMGPLGGPDNHRAQDVTGVLVGHAAGINVFEASRRGELVILQRPTKLYTLSEYRAFRRRDGIYDSAWNQRVAAHRSAQKPPARVGV